MKFFLIYLGNREVAVQAKTKGDATSVALEKGLIQKWDLFDDPEIFEITQQEYSKLKT